MLFFTGFRRSNNVKYYYIQGEKMRGNLSVGANMIQDGLKKRNLKRWEETATIKLFFFLLIIVVLFIIIRSFREDFFKLCAQGSPEKVMEALRAGFNINAEDENGLTPLMHAARSNSDSRVIKILAAAGAEVNACNEWGWTPLMWAAFFNSNPEIIEALIENGARVNVRDRRDRTPLMSAANANVNPQVTKALIKAGADINACSKSGWTALISAAASNKNPEVVKVLLESGADAGIVDRHGKRALDYGQKNKYIKDTEVFWQLQAATFR